MPEEQKKLTTRPDGRPSVISSPDVCLEPSWLKLQMRQRRAREPDLTRRRTRAEARAGELRRTTLVHERGVFLFHKRTTEECVEFHAEV